MKKIACAVFLGLFATSFAYAADDMKGDKKGDMPMKKDEAKKDMKKSDKDMKKDSMKKDDMKKNDKAK